MHGSWITMYKDGKGTSLAKGHKHKGLNDSMKMVHRIALDLTYLGPLQTIMPLYDTPHIPNLSNPSLPTTTLA